MCGELIKRAGSSTERQTKGPCCPPWARDGRGRPADSDGGWGLPASLSTHTRLQEGRAFLGTGNGGHSPPAPAHLSSNHGNRHWPVETLVPEFLASIWQRPSFSCKPSTDSFPPPQVGGTGYECHQGRVQEASSDLTGDSSRFPHRGLCICSPFQ